MWGWKGPLFPGEGVEGPEGCTDSMQIAFKPKEGWRTLPRGPEHGSSMQHKKSQVSLGAKPLTDQTSYSGSKAPLDPALLVRHVTEQPSGIVPASSFGRGYLHNSTELFIKPSGELRC